MSRISASFGRNYRNEWDGGSEFFVEATFTNHGAKTQVYDVTYIYDSKSWNLLPTNDFEKL